MAERIKIPSKTETKILLRNKHSCCICRDPKSGQEVIIHHIDGDPSNNNENNLAVLCLNHASMADAGLKKGKLGSGKKLTPDEVKLFKQTWEKKVLTEIKVERSLLPLKERKQLEILYKFEISKRKNEILALPQKSEQIRKDNYEFLQQLVIEEFITGIKLRPIILRALGDIAVQSAGENYLSLPLIDAISGLFLHLIGPKDVKMYSDDKGLLLKSLDELKTIGSYAGELSDDSRLLRKSCKAIYELAEISSWYKFSEFLTKAKKVLNSIKKDCLKYESIKKDKNKEKIIRERVGIVDNTIRSIKKLE